MGGTTMVEVTSCNKGGAPEHPRLPDRPLEHRGLTLQRQPRAAVRARNFFKVEAGDDLV